MVLYAPHFDGSNKILQTRSESDGSVIDQYTPSTTVFSATELDGSGNVYHVGYYGDVHKYDSNYNQQWTYSTGHSDARHIAVTPNGVYIDADGASGAEIHQISLNDGSFIRKTSYDDSSGEMVGLVAASNGDIYMLDTSTSEQAIYQYDSQLNKLDERSHPAGNDYSGLAITANDDVHAIGGSNHYVYPGGTLSGGNENTVTHTQRYMNGFVADPDNPSEVWILFRDDGLAKYDSSSRITIHSSVPEDSIARDVDGNLYLGDNDGLEKHEAGNFSNILWSTTDNTRYPIAALPRYNSFPDAYSTTVAKTGTASNTPSSSASLTTSTISSSTGTVGPQSVSSSSPTVVGIRGADALSTLVASSSTPLALDVSSSSTSAATVTGSTASPASIAPTASSTSTATVGSISTPLTVSLIQSAQGVGALVDANSTILATEALQSALSGAQTVGVASSISPPTGLSETTSAGSSASSTTSPSMPTATLALRDGGIVSASADTWASRMNRETGYVTPARSTTFLPLVDGALGVLAKVAPTPVSYSFHTWGGNFAETQSSTSTPSIEPDVLVASSEALAVAPTTITSVQAELLVDGGVHNASAVDHVVTTPTLLTAQYFDYAPVSFGSDSNVSFDSGGADADFF